MPHDTAKLTFRERTVVALLFCIARIVGGVNEDVRREINRIATSISVNS